MRSAGMSFTEYHNPFLLFRSQARGTSIGRMTTASTGPRAHPGRAGLAVASAMR
jgi:hypothetical protein